MIMEKDSFVFRRSWVESAKKLSAKARLDIYGAIIEYGLNGNIVDLQPMAKMVFNVVKDEIDHEEAERKRKAEISEIRRKAVGCRWSKRANFVNTKNDFVNTKQDFVNTKTGFVNTKSDFVDTKDQKTDFVNTKQDFVDTKKSFVNTKTKQKSSSSRARTSNNNNILTINNIDSKVEKKDRERKDEKSASKPSRTPAELLEARKEDFYSSLVPYVTKYGKEMIRSFFDYWSESNRSKTKMRFELERTWETSRRLVTWASRDKNFKLRNYGAYRTDNQEQKAAEDALEVMQRIKSRAGIAE